MAARSSCRALHRLAGPPGLGGRGRRDGRLLSQARPPAAVVTPPPAATRSPASSSPSAPVASPARRPRASGSGWAPGCTRLSPALVAALTALVVAVGVAHTSRVAGGADCYGYVSQAELWMRGQLIQTDPLAVALWEGVSPPCGSRRSATRWARRGARSFPMYPPGLPLMMAGCRAGIRAASALPRRPALWRPPRRAHLRARAIRRGQAHRARLGEPPRGKPHLPDAADPADERHPGRRRLDGRPGVRPLGQWRRAGPRLGTRRLARHPHTPQPGAPRGRGRPPGVPSLSPRGASAASARLRPGSSPGS